MITEKRTDTEAQAAGMDVDANGVAAVAAPLPASDKQARASFSIPPGMLAAAVLALFLWVSIGGELTHAWRSDKALSHGPLVPIIAGALLWLRKDELKDWSSASPVGLLGLLGSTLLFMLAVWADVEFMKSLALIGVLLSGIYFLGGRKTLGAAVGPLGFLLFLIPWPTSLTERLAFPLQLMSSTYAALLSGVMGLNVERDGVNLRVLDNNTPPGTLYEVVVAQACSGLTSMTVLLALGYLIVYFTPIKLGWRALLMATVVPLTLLCNSVRLSVILLIGAEFNKSAAKWVHDNEGPVLIFFCSIALMGVRALLMKWLDSRDKSEEGPALAAAEA